MSNLMMRFVKEENGATAIEYGLIASLIAVALITVLGTTGDSLKTVFTNISTKLQGAVSAS